MRRCSEMAKIMAMARKKHLGTAIDNRSVKITEIALRRRSKSKVNFCRVTGRFDNVGSAVIISSNAKQ